MPREGNWHRVDTGCSSYQPADGGDGVYIRHQHAVNVHWSDKHDHSDGSGRGAFLSFGWEGPEAYQFIWVFSVGDEQ